MTRVFKGKSIIALPERFVILDVETSGLDTYFDFLIEVGALRYDHGECTRFASFVKPPVGRTIAPYITELTGITNEMLRDAPPAEAVVPQLLDFIGADLIVAHNANYDVNFVYDAAEDLGRRLPNDFIDTVRIARKCLPELPHHRLGDVAAALGIAQDGAHRSGADCETTLECYLEMRRCILAEMDDAAFAALFKKKTTGGVSRVDAFLKGADLAGLVEVEDSPIFGKTVVFTGALERMQRAQALELVAKLGGTPADSLTAKTNILVVGNAEFSKAVKDGKTAKMRKAEAYAQKGMDIITISENAFFDMLDYE